MKKLILLTSILSLATSLAACGNEEENKPTLNQTTQNLSFDDKLQLQRDKQQTASELNALNNQEKEEFNKMYSKLSTKQREILDNEMKFDVLRYNQLKYLNTNLKGYDYIFVSKKSEKFNILMVDVIEKLAKENKNSKILVYLPGETITTFENKNITVKTENKDIDKLKLKHYPMTFIQNKNKTYLTLTGYYDYNTLQDKIKSFGGFADAKN